MTGRAATADRLAGSVTAALWAARHGAAVLRVHDVAATRDALAVWRQLEGEDR
jgi:dihydropteroate synthase